jgi:hypothetical protein
MSDALLPKCPICKRHVTDDDATCACGFDLAAERALLERYMRPPSGAAALPLGVLRKLSPMDRATITSAIEAARRSHGPHEPKPRRASAKGLRFQLLACDRFEPDEIGYATSTGVHRLPVPRDVTPEMYLRAIWFVRAGEIGAFEEVEQTRAELDATLAETERGLLEDVDG